MYNNMTLLAAVLDEDSNYAVCLIETGSDEINDKISNTEDWAPGLSILSLAIFRNDIKVVDALLDRDDLEIDSVDSKNRSALCIAVMKSRWTMAKKLIRNGANIHIMINEHSLYNMLYINGEYDTIKTLLQRYDFKHTQPRILLACKCGLDDMAFELVEQGYTNTTDENNTCVLSLAIKNKLNNVVDYILATDRKNPIINQDNVKKYGPLLYSCMYDDSGIIKKIINYKAFDINQQDDNKFTPLLYACKHSDITTVIKLLKHKDTNINLCDQSNSSPLITAIVHNNYTIAIELITNKCDVNIKLSGNVNWFENNTALIIAARAGALDVVECLLARDDIDINSTDIHGYSALDRSIEHSHKNVAIKLIRTGCIVTKEILISALNNKHEEISKSILEMNNPDVDEYILKLAINNNYVEIIELLLDNPKLKLDSKHNILYLLKDKPHLINKLCEKFNMNNKDTYMVCINNNIVTLYEELGKNNYKLSKNDIMEIKCTTNMDILLDLTENDFENTEIYDMYISHLLQFDVLKHVLIKKLLKLDKCNNDMLYEYINSNMDTKTNKVRCNICYDNLPNILFTPCNHATICSDCNSKHIYRQCFVCRTDIIKRHKIYL
jgi:ankyrin repeat protein